LAGELRKIRLSRLNGQRLRNAIIKVAKERFKHLLQQAKTATQYF
jgi:hypothetical protein